LLHNNNIQSTTAHLILSNGKCHQRNISHELDEPPPHKSDLRKMLSGKEIRDSKERLTGWETGFYQYPTTEFPHNI